MSFSHLYLFALCDLCILFLAGVSISYAQSYKLVIFRQFHLYIITLINSLLIQFETLSITFFKRIECKLF